MDLREILAGGAGLATIDVSKRLVVTARAALAEKQIAAVAVHDVGGRSGATPGTVTLPPQGENLT